MSDSVRPHRWQPTRLPRPWDSPGKNTEVGCHFLLQCMQVKSEREVAQSCPTLSDPMDCSLPGSSGHGIFQARALDWGAIAFSVLRAKAFPRVADCKRSQSTLAGRPIDLDRAGRCVFPLLPDCKILPKPQPMLTKSLIHCQGL